MNTTFRKLARQIGGKVITRKQKYNACAGLRGVNLREEYRLIQQKKSKLPRRLRDQVVKLIEKK